MPYEFIEEEKNTSLPPTRAESKLIKGAKDVASTALRPSVRAVEQGIGLPGDVFSLINDFIAKPIAEHVLGQKPVEYQETYLGKILPKTSRHAENIKKATGGFFEPKNEYEKFVDDVVQDSVSLLLPFKFKIPFKRTAKNALALSLGSNLAGEAAKDFTGSEEYGSAAKMGSLFLLSLMNPQSSRKMVSELYKTAESSIPSGTKVNAVDLSNNLNGLKSKVLAGRSASSLAPSEEFVIQESDKILNLIKNGKIDVESAWAAKRSLNEQLNKVLFSTPDKMAKGRARHLAKQINGELSTVLDDYANVNKTFKNSFIPAEEAYKVISKSNMVEKFVKDNLAHSPATYGLLHLFGGTIGGLASKAVLPYQSAKILYRINKSPTLRKHYAEATKAALIQNSTIFNRELQKLDKGLQQEDKKEEFGYEFVD